jgi:nicotinate-nucleotide--dimethylbenzimidazole phosphoribosyltransferase
MPFQHVASFADIRALVKDLPGPDAGAVAAARAREAQLTKPGGALGRLEKLAEWLAAWQGRHPPRVERARVLVFAGNHGVASRGVSAYPAAVTAQMVANFRAGGAAVNQIARSAGAGFEVHAMELERPTADFVAAPAMSEAECVAAFRSGLLSVEPGLDLLAVGEMGIGNTTSATALCAALLGGALADPLAALARLGGREIAAMAGAILAARLQRTPVLLDGFVCGAAAAVLQRLEPAALEHCEAAHLSAEPGHRRLLEAVKKSPLLLLNMRLGEASGAALAIAIVKAAAAAHAGMATFGEAGVAGRLGDA